MKKLIVLLLVFNCTILNAQSCVHDTLQYIDLKVYQPNNYLFSPLEKGEIWFSGREYNLSQWYELDVESKMISTLATKFGVKKAIYFTKSYLIDSLDNSFWFVADSLYRYDWSTKKAKAYMRTYDYGNCKFQTKERIFFIGANCLAVYEKKSRNFKIIYDKPPFSLKGFARDTKTGNVYINENTYLDEETYEVHYCTDDKVYYFQSGMVGEFDKLNFEKKYNNFLYHSGENHNAINPNYHYDDEQGCWHWDNLTLYYRPHDTKQTIGMPMENLSHWRNYNHMLFYDNCNIYYSEMTKLYIYPKKHLISQMKSFNHLLFVSEKMQFDSLKNILFPSDEVEKKATFDVFFSKINILKNRFDASYNYQLKENILEICRNYSNYYEKGNEKKKISIIKAADSGKLPLGFQGFCNTYVRELVEKGDVYIAYKKYKQYHKLYPSLTVKPNNYDSIRLLQLDKLIKILNRNDRKIKAPDSLLWAKYNPLNSFCDYWFENECGTDNRIALNVLRDFIKKYPQSALIDLVEYTYIIETQVRGCCSPPDFSQKQINIFENFIKKYPQSKYKNKVLEAEMRHFTNTRCSSF